MLMESHFRIVFQPCNLNLGWGEGEREGGCTRKRERKKGLPALMAAWNSVFLGKRDERLSMDSNKSAVNKSTLID